MTDQGKLPVDRMREGDMVQAVKNGPRGKVVDADRAGWTLVQYPTRNRWVGAGLVCYQHGQDRLYLCDDDGFEAIRRDACREFEQLRNSLALDDSQQPREDGS